MTDGDVTMKNFFRMLRDMFRKPRKPEVLTPVAPPAPAPVAPPPVLAPVAPAPVAVKAKPAMYPFYFKGKTLLIADCRGPINAGWIPSMEGLVLGGAFLPNSPAALVVSDPSNAPEGYPARSPESFPLFYAIGGDGKPVGQPRVSFNGVTLDNDAAVPAYLAAARQRDANIDAWVVAFHAERFHGPIVAASLSQNDRAWLYAMSQKFRDVQTPNPLGQIQSGCLHRVVLSGSNPDMARCINDGELEHRNYNDPASLGEPDNLALKAVVLSAIDSAKNGQAPVPVRTAS
jgi:hypothetical protein